MADFLEIIVVNYLVLVSCPVIATCPGPLLLVESMANIIAPKKLGKSKVTKAKLTSQGNLGGQQKVEKHGFRNPEKIGWDTDKKEQIVNPEC